MQKKLTITVDQEIYEGLHTVIGPRKISRFIQDLVRPHLVFPDMQATYAEMANDEHREKEAEEWAKMTFKDISHETAVWWDNEDMRAVERAIKIQLGL